MRTSARKASRTGLCGDLHEWASKKGYGEIYTTRLAEQGHGEICINGPPKEKVYKAMRTFAQQGLPNRVMGESG